LTKIFIVDDHPVVREGLVAALDGKNGIEVAGVFGSAEEALTARGNADVIVLDLVMPRMDGWEFMRRLRAVAGHERTPVLLLTATASSGAALAGAQAILRKPFVVEALLRQVADLSP